MANLTPLALATLYALAKGNKDEDVQPTQAASPTPAAPAPVNLQKPRTDMSQMFGATQDTEDMEAAPQSPPVANVKPQKPAVTKKPVATAPAKTSVKQPTKQEVADTQESADAELGPKKFNKPGLFDYDPTGTLQYKLANTEVRKRMLTQAGMDPSLADQAERRNPRTGRPYAKGGAIKSYATGGQVSAGKRGDGIATKGHTRGRLV